VFICIYRELSKGLIFLRPKPTVLRISVYHSVMKLSRIRTGFFSFSNYGTTVARTSHNSNISWHSLFEFEPPKFYCISLSYEDNRQEIIF